MKIPKDQPFGIQPLIKSELDFQGGKAAICLWQISYQLF